MSPRKPIKKSSTALERSELGWRQDIAVPMADLVTLGRQWVADHSVESLDACLAHLIVEETLDPKRVKKSHELLAQCWVNGLHETLPLVSKAFAWACHGSRKEVVEQRDHWAEKVASAYKKRKQVEAKQNNTKPKIKENTFEIAIVTGLVKAMCLGDWERVDSIQNPIPNLPLTHPFQAYSINYSPDIAEIKLRKERAVVEFEAFMISISIPLNKSCVKKVRHQKPRI